MTQQESARVQVEEVVRRIVAGFSPDRIVVFGSHARGEQTRESDLDLLVVMPVTGSRRKTTPAIATGITNRLWEVSDLVEAWEAEERMEKVA
jgi:predicted nucleotidyltransferase